MKNHKKMILIFILLNWLVQSMEFTLEDIENDKFSQFIRKREEKIMGKIHDLVKNENQIRTYESNAFDTPIGKERNVKNTSGKKTDIQSRLFNFENVKPELTSPVIEYDDFFSGLNLFVAEKKKHDILQELNFRIEEAMGGIHPRKTAICELAVRNTHVTCFRTKFATSFWESIKTMINNEILQARYEYVNALGKDQFVEKVVVSVFVKQGMDRHCELQKFFNLNKKNPKHTPEDLYDYYLVLKLLQSAYEKVRKEKTLYNGTNPPVSFQCVIGALEHYFFQYERSSDSEKYLRDFYKVILENLPAAHDRSIEFPRIEELKSMEHDCNDDEQNLNPTYQKDCTPIKCVVI